jgi:hypothetical protein
MSARRKLNGAHLTGGLAIAGLVGLVTGSWLLFVVVFGTLTVIDVAAGNIRPSRWAR